MLEFRRVELVDPPPAALDEYAGEYTNDALSATYRFSVKDGALWLRVGGRSQERLDPTVADEFIPHVRTLHDNRIIEFRRDGNRRVVGLAITFWRVKGLELTRKEVSLSAVPR